MYFFCAKFEVHENTTQLFTWGFKKTHFEDDNISYIKESLINDIDRMYCNKNNTMFCAIRKSDKSIVH